MKYQDALEILELHNSHDNVTTDEIKKQYRKLALQYHPDKNGNSEDSNARFQVLNDAYHVLLDSDEHARYVEGVAPSSHDAGLGYAHMLRVFIDSIFADSNNAEFVDVIKEVVKSGCEKISIKLFETLDKDTSLQVLTFISTYRKTLHISDETITEVKNIIAKKYEGDQVYILNPSIDDMLNNNVYRLNVDGRHYIVPLWHSEMYFDGKAENEEIIVKCIPKLPENAWIDDNNRLHIDVKLPFRVAYFSSGVVEFSLSQFTFHIENILFKQTHTYYLKSQGLSKIDENDIYSVDEKCGMFVNLTFTDANV